MADVATFKDYLTGKKIDADQFKRSEHQLYIDLEKQFDQMHPNSFTDQKLFIINPLRRKYLLKEEAKTTAKPKIAAKPKFKKPS